MQLSLRTLLAIVTAICVLLGLYVFAGTNDLLMLFITVTFPLVLSWGMLAVLKLRLGVTDEAAVLAALATGAIGSPLILGLLAFLESLLSVNSGVRFEFSPVESFAFATCFFACFSIPLSATVWVYYVFILLPRSTSRRQ